MTALATATQTAITLRALEHQVTALTELALPELPHAARAILRSITTLLMVCRWQIEDQEIVRRAALAGDGNDL